MDKAAFIDGIDTLRTRFEQYAPESGDFSPFHLDFDTFDTTKNTSSFRVNVFKSDDFDGKKKIIILEAVAFDLSYTYKADMYINAGDRDKILAILSSDNFLERLQHVFITLDEMLSDM